MRRPTHMSVSKHIGFRALQRSAITALAVLLAGTAYFPTVVKAATPPQLVISQTPLSVTSPVHPQVIFAIGNSQSMDGDLSGAIMTGSGTVTGLSNSSSPVSYTVPSGYTPPSTTANANLTLALPGSGCSAVTVPAGNEPYTTTCNSTQYDTSASRLNVAKEGILAIMNQYLPTTDFALEDYSTSGTSLYTTWVYYMSTSSGFSFTNTQPASGTNYVTNPCWNYSSSSSSTVKSNCSSIASTLYGSSSSVADQYMLVGASSDDPSINDVLYSSGNSNVYVDYGSINPANPYPPNKSLANYESGSITVSYGSVVPGGNGTSTGPTNAGYVPYSKQVMYSQRGFGYYVNSVSYSTGNNVVAMTTAGTSPTAASVSTAMGKFSAYLAPETNSTGSKEIKALAYQSPLSALVAGAYATLKTSLAAASGDCTPPKQYVVLVTDGLPTMDSKGNNWPPLGSASATGYGVTASFNADGSLNTSYVPPTGQTNDQALIDTVNEIQTLQKAGIETYVIGLGAGVDPSANPAAAQALKAMAVAGGTSSTSATGYFPATSTSALVADLSAILSNVASQNTSSSSSAANSTSLTANSDLYQATFNPGSATSNAWIGDLSEYGVSASAAINATPTWSAQAQLDAQGTSRYIATWDPYHLVGTTVTPAGVGFSWSNLSSTLQSELQPSDSNGSLRVSYLRGDHSHEQNQTGGIFRTRAHLLGDIVDSSPAFVGPPSDYFPDASYQAFVTLAANANRTPILYVGANDGMLHGFNANTGKEVMGFIPNGVFANLYKLSDPYYLYNHQFYVDGTPYVDDALLSDGNWHTLLVGGENAGGKSIYAIDVTNPAGYTSDTAVANDVKWEFTDSDMGYSYSAPVIVRSNAVSVTDASNNKKVAGFAVIFGNGYNSASGQPIFYAVDASTGAQIAKINLCTATGVPATACSSSAANGLSSVTAANSSGLVGVPQDMVYAGDLQGNLWAINIADSNPANWTVKLLFQARDSSGNDQPITSAPSVTANPNFPGNNGQSYLGLMVYFGTGMFLQTSDLTNTSTQSFYGVWDNTSDLANYATAPSAIPYTRANLQSQTISLGSYTVAGVSTPAIFSTSNPVNLTYANLTYTNPSPPPANLTASPVEGWYFDLSPLASSSSAPAPRVYNASEVESGGVLFAINLPPNSGASACGTPTSYLMNVRYASGTPFAQASIGFGGGISIAAGTASGAGATVTNANPTGIFISNGYSAAPTSVRTGQGTNEQFISTGTSLVPVPTIGDKSGRVGWWQVQ